MSYTQAIKHSCNHPEKNMKNKKNYFNGFVFIEKDEEEAELDDDIFDCAVKPIECTLSKAQLKNLGKEAIFEYEVDDLQRYELGGEFFGLYEFFTEETQHCHCTKNDFYYILGMVKYVKDKQGKTLNLYLSEFIEKAMEYAVQMTWRHIQKVHKDLFGTECIETDISKIEEIFSKRGIDSSSNYFYDYQMGQYYKRYYEIILGVK